MGRVNYKVFSEGTVGNLVLKNRLVRSATFEKQMTDDGRVTDDILQTYTELAAGGTGMIITGLTAITQAGKGYTKQACIYSDKYISEIAKIADVVHKTDNRCVIIAQIGHCGRQVLEHENAECVGPSAVKSPILVKKARELSVDEVETIITDFANSIERVKRAGFDGVQLHAAHGYLLSSFLSPYTNRRIDQFGGSVRNRVKIIRDIIFQARQKVGSFPILIKINCDDHIEGGISKENFPELMKEIEATGVDAVEVSGAMWDCLARSEAELGFVPVPVPESRTRINKPEKQSYYYDYVKTLDTHLPMILVGGNRNIERIENILLEGKVDFISLCRPLISEPGLPNRWLEGTGNENSNCVSCNACMTPKEGLYCALRKNDLNMESFEKRLFEVWRDIFK